MLMVVSPKLISVREAATILSVTSSTIKRYIKKKLIRGGKIGGAYHILKEDIDAMVEKIENMDRAKEAK